jgi:2,6-dihydroxypyridine 3-monooxygenase
MYKPMPAPRSSGGDEERSYELNSWNTVYRSMLACFDADRYLLGHELLDIDVSQPRWTFANAVTATHDLVVCADGVGSAVRRNFDPTATLRHSGYVAWRGVVPEDELSSETRAALDDAITYYVHANSHILVYPIPGRDGSVVPGERLSNIVWYRNYAAGDDLDELLLDRNGVRREVSVPPGALRDLQAAEARAVAAARLPACMAEVVAAIDQLYIQVVNDLEVNCMAKGRAALIGDAAFSVRPHAAAGTAKAAADAWTLRDALAASADDVEGAGRLGAWSAGARPIASRTDASDWSSVAVRRHVGSRRSRSHLRALRPGILMTARGRGGSVATTSRSTSRW